jgi:hypothetical protein
MTAGYDVGLGKERRVKSTLGDYFGPSPTGVGYGLAHSAYTGRGCGRIGHNQDGGGKVGEGKVAILGESEFDHLCVSLSIA